MLYEVITPDYLIDTYRVFRSVPASAAADLAIEGARGGQGGGPALVITEDHGTLNYWELIATLSAQHVITSYSIHYTKLYECTTRAPRNDIASCLSCWITASPVISR